MISWSGTSGRGRRAFHFTYLRGQAESEPIDSPALIAFPPILGYLPARADPVPYAGASSGKWSKFRKSKSASALLTNSSGKHRFFLFLKLWTPKPLLVRHWSWVFPRSFIDKGLVSLLLSRGFPPQLHTTLQSCCDRGQTKAKRKGRHRDRTKTWPPSPETSPERYPLLTINQNRTDDQARSSGALWLNVPSLRILRRTLIHHWWAGRSSACFKEFGIAKIGSFPAPSFLKPNRQKGIGFLDFESGFRLYELSHSGLGQKRLVSKAWHARYGLFRQCFP